MEEEVEKEKKIHLTNEELVKKFKNNFDLVNYAIQLAENMIHTGRDSRVKSDVQNRALLVLEEIFEGKDHFDEIVEKIIEPSDIIKIDGVEKAHGNEMTHEDKTHRRAKI